MAKHRPVARRTPSSAWTSFTICVVLTVTAIGLTFVVSIRAAAATS